MFETDFQELFRLYSAKDALPSVKEAAVIQLHEHIYRFAAHRLRHSEDVSSDFYLFYQDKIEHLFLDYDPARGISFLVFVTVRLRFAFLKFIGRRKISRSVYSAVDDFADPEEELKLASASPVFESSSDERQSIRQMLEILPRETQIILRLYFGFPLKISMVREMVNARGSLTFLKDYRKFLQKHERSLARQKDQFYKIQEKLGKLYSQKLAGTENSEHAVKREMLLKELQEQKPTVTQRDLAHLTGFTLSTVNRRIKEGLDELRRYSKDEGTE